jgi:hypothetical protein
MRLTDVHGEVVTGVWRNIRIVGHNYFMNETIVASID